MKKIFAYNLILLFLSLNTSLAAFTECSSNEYSAQVETKYLEYDENDKPYYSKQFHELPEEWSLAFPGVGLVQITKKAGVNSPAFLRVSYLDKNGAVLSSDELKLSLLEGSNNLKFQTHSDLDKVFEKFFKFSIEGQTKIEVIAQDKSVCTFKMGILGSLEQED